jgi:hypothetical protein
MFDEAGVFTWHRRGRLDEMDAAFYVPIHGMRGWRTGGWLTRWYFER